MNIRKKKAQVSIEYMFIIGFATIVTTSLIIIYYSFTQESREEVTSSQIMQVVKKVVDAAESVYYLGEPSQTTLKINMPSNVVSTDLSSGNEIVFKVRTKGGESDIVQSSSVNITGSLPTDKGLYTVTVKAKSNHV